MVDDTLATDDHRPDRPRVALLRGADLNPYEMQAYEPLLGEFDLLAVGRRQGRHETDLIGIPIHLLASVSQHRHLSGMWRRARARNIANGDPDRLFGLSRLVRGFDILHTAETAISLSEQAAELVTAGQAKLVLTCWETIPFRFDDDPLLSRRKATVRNATSLFIAVTERARAALLAEGVSADRIVVVPAAVDCDRFHPGIAGGDFRRQWDVPTSAPLVVYVGRLIQEKGVVELLRAFGAGSTRDAHLVFVGSGDQSHRLRVAATALGVSERIRIVPAVSYADIPNIYATADVVAAPSLPTPYWEEQFGMVLVEAMASGRALVSTSSGAITEVVGDAAVLVPPYDPEALCAALEQLLGDPQARVALSQRALERASRLYGIPRVAPQLAGCYRRVLAG
jgi:alpha-maltose-1-phosphate synthase